MTLDFLIDDVKAHSDWIVQDAYALQGHLAGFIPFSGTMSRTILAGTDIVSLKTGETTRTSPEGHAGLHFPRPQPRLVGTYKAEQEPMLFLALKSAMSEAVFVSSSIYKLNLEWSFSGDGRYVQFLLEGVMITSYNEVTKSGELAVDNYTVLHHVNTKANDHEHSTSTRLVTTV